MPRKPWRTLLAAVVAAIVVAVGLGAAPAAAAPALTITLNSVGSRYLDADIPIKGYIGGNPQGNTMQVSLQRNDSGTWNTVDTTTTTTLGAYQIPPQRVPAAGTWQFRSQVGIGGTTLATSDPISVVVKPVTAPPPPPPPPTGDTATVNGSTAALTGVNVPRGKDALVMYTPAKATTGTNQYGYEAAVVGGKVVKVENGVGNMAIPADGYVLSGHGTARSWLTINAKVGATATVDAAVPPPATPTGTIELFTVGSRYVGADIPLNGSMLFTPGATIDLIGQYNLNGNWAEITHQHGITAAGRYSLGPITAPTEPGTYQYRVLMYHNQSVLIASSNTIDVVVKALPVEPTPPPPPDLTDPNKQPAPVTEERFLDGPKQCQTLSVTVYHQKRTNTWTWDTAQSKWVPAWSDWMTHHETVRQATVADCVNLVSAVAGDALLPDLRIKQLNKCGAGDLAATNNTCFKIVNPAPYVADFPQLNGKKLLKFPVLTMNAGDGPAEVIADRSSADETQWTAYQTFYRPNGERQSQVAPNVDFYFAGDGHNHWHFTDFDDYWIEQLDGTRVRSAEKHGYCLLDNTLLTSMKGLPGVPTEPVYVEASTCGEGLPNALTILQGLSKGWGDTYPTSLPDQALDITGLPDGRYRVGVTADAIGAVREKSENNNTATIEVTITGNTVAIHPETAQGGVN